jgi:hypothetical protein
VARHRSHSRAAAIGIGALLGLAAPAVWACSPWAEQVVAWDPVTDVVVVASWIERERVPRPGSLVPDHYELRRISSGDGVAMYLCPGAQAPAGRSRPPCDWRAGLAAQLPPGVRWDRTGPPLPGGRLRVRATATPGTEEYALEARGPRGWQRLSWLDFISRDYPERRRYRIGSSGNSGNSGKSGSKDGTVVVAVEYHSRGGNCAHTSVQLFSLRQEDLDDPRNPGRRARLLSQVRTDVPIGYWRTVAELGPLPPERLIQALESADTAWHSPLAARWWREATAGLPADSLAPLTEALRKHPGLHQTRALLGIGGATKAAPPRPRAPAAPDR